MGADLYIKDVFEANNTKYENKFNEAVHERNVLQEAFGRDSKEVKKAQKKVEDLHEKMYSVGYFRDSYNCWTMLRTLGLSWWNDISKLQNQNGFIDGENLNKFKKMVANAQQILPDKDTLEKWGATVSEEGENSLPEIHKYFKEKRQQLLDFIDLAIKHNKPIEASL